MHPVVAEDGGLIRTSEWQAAVSPFLATGPCAVREKLNRWSLRWFQATGPRHDFSGNHSECRRKRRAHEGDLSGSSESSSALPSRPSRQKAAAGKIEICLFA